jgi:CRISPR-associated protein Cas6
MPLIEVVFPVLGTDLPTDHLYPLYAALCRKVPAFHEGGLHFRFGPINGQHGGRGLIRLFERSRLRLRLPDDRIATILPLAGKALEVAEHRIRLGVPYVRALVPAAALAARVVTFKHATEPERFLAVARRKLDEDGTQGEAGIRRLPSGPRAGEPARKVVRIKGKRVIGFGVVVAGLSAEESIRLQEKGLGGRRRMGCGFFVPVRE